MLTYINEHNTKVESALTVMRHENPFPLYSQMQMSPH